MFDFIFRRKPRQGCTRWSVTHFPSYIGTPREFIDWRDAFWDSMTRPSPCEIRIIDRVTGFHFVNSEITWREPNATVFEKKRIEEQNNRKFLAYLWK